MTSRYRVIKINTCAGVITLARESAMPSVQNNIDQYQAAVRLISPPMDYASIGRIIEDQLDARHDDRVDALCYSFAGFGTWNLAPRHVSNEERINWNVKWLKMWRQVAEAHDHYCFCTEKEWCYKDGEFYKLHATSEEG